MVSGWLARLSAASYGFKLKLRFCFSTTQVTETRTGPLGCSNYDNLDSVSSVLVQSPENKVQLQGLSGFHGFLQLFTALFICLIAPWARKSIKIFFLKSSNKLSPSVFTTALPSTLPRPDDSTKPCCFYRSAADPPRLPEGRLRPGCPQLHRL